MNRQPENKRNRRLAARRSPRRSTKIMCHQGTLGLGPNLAVSLLDLSETGVRLVVKKSLEKGQEIEVGLVGMMHVRPVKFQAQVVWSEPKGDGTFLIGARFQKSVTYADLTTLT